MQPARAAALAAVTSPGAVARRAFVDATGTPVVLPPAVRRLVATDEAVGALLLELGAALVGCAGSLDGVPSVGAPRAPDPRAVAALRPDVIVSAAAGRAPDLACPADGLRRVAPLVVVDLSRPAAAAADLRALVTPVARERLAPPPPAPPVIIRPRLG